MSTDFNDLFDLQEQLCYIKCVYCTTLLLVSVPCRSLSTVVTVRCGHCTCLLSVNMMKASLLPLHLFTPLNQADQDDELKKEVFPEEAGAAEKIVEKRSPTPIMPSDEEDEDASPVYQVINKPPEKKQRAPSAYNCFIREEIQRLKAVYPGMTHKQAFSSASKNWAHFPPCQREEGKKQGDKDAGLI